MKFLGIFLLTLFIATEIHAVCDTKEKKEEREKQKALKIMGYSGSVLDQKTGKYFAYDIKSCKWKEVKE